MTSPLFRRMAVAAQSLLVLGLVWLVASSDLLG